MKAATFHGPSDIRIEDVADPEAPGDEEVLLRVLRAAICGTDATEWDHGPVLAKPPVILGHEFVGEVVGFGSGRQPFGLGQRVVSGAGVWCRKCQWCARGRTNLCAEYRTLGLQLAGGLAQFVRVPVRTLVAVPPEVPNDAAALAQPIAVALHAVRRAGVAPGESCAIIGVGGIGAFIVAGAAARGAAPLIAIDVDPDRLQTAKALGATIAIDARDRDLTTVIREATGGDGPDVVIEASGAPHAPAAALAAAKRGGRVLIVGLQPGLRELDLLQATVREIDLHTTLAHVCDEDLPDAVALLASTDVAERTIEKTISLDALIEGGIVSLVQRTAKGKILVDPWA